MHKQIYIQNIHTYKHLTNVHCEINYVLIYNCIYKLSRSVVFSHTLSCISTWTLSA